MHLKRKITFSKKSDRSDLDNKLSYQKRLQNSLIKKHGDIRKVK